ncbi:F-BAR and double SH3 domains protein 1-like [Neosynchiropus ocellatus]
MQRRSRKVAECQQVKLKFAEQVSKLHLKHHRNTELLQDIRSFSKQRTFIEREYGQALQKLASQFQRRDWQKGNSETHISGTISGVWCSLLDATAKSAASRLAAAGDYQQLNEHICSTLRNAKDTEVKRSLKELQNEQEEVMAALKELNRIKKQYLQLSHIANVARGKAADAQMRSKECDKLLTEARNEYLLTLAAVNTHECHYYTEGLPRKIQQINSDIYDCIKRHFSLLCGTEMEMCLTTHKQYRGVWDGVIMLARETHLQQFLRDSDSFKRTTDYTFQPAPQDQVCVLQDICGAEEDSWLNKEAKKWVAQASNDYKMAAQAEKLSRVKAEARLDLLAQSVEGTERWIDLAMTQAEQDPERDEKLSERTKSTEEFSEDELDLIYFVEEDDRKGAIFSDPTLTSILCLCPAAGQVTCSYECSTMEGEELREIENGEMEDWFKACDSCGHVGHVLERYMPFLPRPAEDSSLLDTSPCSSETGEPKGAVKQDAATALHSYQAQSGEELSFQEGALIDVENRCLEGGFKGRIGVFPSVLVEMTCDEEQLGEEEDAGQLPCGPLTLRSIDLDKEKALATEPPSALDRREDISFCQILEEAVTTHQLPVEVV